MSEDSDKPMPYPLRRRDGSPMFSTDSRSDPAVPRQPTIGSIVWYNDARLARPCAAIVLAHDDVLADVAIVSLLVVGAGSLSFIEDVEYGTEPGQWRWSD